MPALRRSAVGLLLAAGLVGAGITIKAPSSSAARNASLVVSPAQGGATTQLTVTYRWPSTTTRQRGNPRSCTPDHITFEWDGSPLGRAAAATAGNSCVAVLRVAPPPGTRPGSHTITVDADPSVRARYTVAARPTSAGTTSTAAAPESTAAAAADPQATGSQDALASAPDPTGQTGVASGRNDEDHEWSAWYIAAGVILFLGGAAAFGTVVWRTRRTKAEADDVRLPAIGDTRPLPLRTRTAYQPTHRRSS
jgi:hypothetical protein